MAKKVKKEKAKKGFNIFDEDESASASSEEELPKDEAGRRSCRVRALFDDELGNARTHYTHPRGFVL